MKQERKVNSINLALVLTHDLLLAKGGIQCGDGPLKAAILRHKTRLHGEFKRLAIKRGVASTSELAQTADERSGKPHRVPDVRQCDEKLTARSTDTPIRESEYGSVVRTSSHQVPGGSWLHVERFDLFKVMAVLPIHHMQAT
jgi:hypothetical protein